MPKIKTSRAAAKRFKKTGTGQLKRMKAYKSHILTKKSQKRKRNLQKSYDYGCYQCKEHEEDSYRIYKPICRGSLEREISRKKRDGKN